MYAEITNVKFNPSTMVLTVEAPEFLHSYMPDKVTIQLTDDSFYGTPGDNRPRTNNTPTLIFLVKTVCVKMEDAWTSDIWVGASKVRFVKDVREFVAETLNMMRVIHVSPENYDQAIAVLNAVFPKGL